MEHIARASDISTDDMLMLRRIVARSFVSRATLAAPQRERLSALGLVQCAMGGVMPTPAGKMAARM